MLKQCAFFYFMKNDPEKIRNIIPAHIKYWKDSKSINYPGGPFSDKSGGLILFEAENIEAATELAMIELQADEWTCMFKHIGEVARGKKICFSKYFAGCSGAACYFGFTQPNEKAGGFLATKEKFKENVTYGNEFYHQIKAKEPQKEFLILSNLEEIEDNIYIEVVNYWVNPLILSGLVTLSNFDSPNNNNVNIPFASGCQSLWTIPYKEKDEKQPKATVGALDPAMRKYIASNTILFSVPAQRFNALSKNIKKSFASENKWLTLIEPNLALTIILRQTNTASDSLVLATHVRRYVLLQVNFLLF